MGQLEIEQNRDQLRRPWAGMARDEGREWWRNNPGAPVDDYARWAREFYEPLVMRNIGVEPGTRLTAAQNEILDDIHIGLAEGSGYRDRFLELARSA